jgi:hypothetical protein
MNSIIAEYQFVKLYRDPEKTDLYAWLCIYPAPKECKYSYIQHWAFVNEEDLQMDGIGFYGEVVATDLIAIDHETCIKPPYNRAEWLKLIQGCPPFKAYMHRKCYYGAEGIIDYVAELNKLGNTYYNISLEGKIDWLVVQSVPKAMGAIQKYYQASLLTTLEAADGACYSGHIEFSKVHPVEEPLYLHEVLNKESSTSMPFPEQLNHKLFEEVSKISLPPSQITVPSDID